MKIDLLIIDPQMDFCSPDGSLFVPGADKDCERAATMIRRLIPKINDIHVTKDEHHYFDRAHPSFLIDSKGEHPRPFTIIPLDDMKNGKWRSVLPQYQKDTEDYLQALLDNKRYAHCIWPPHCLIGSEGNKIVPEVWDALHAWEIKHKTANVDYVTKGSNFLIEHYSAVQAEVPQADDPTTQLNTGLIQVLQTADIIALFGEALTQCVANTGTDIANNFGEENIKKIVLIKDLCSSVPGFEHLAEAFIKDLTGRGMQICEKSEDFFA